MKLKIFIVLFMCTSVAQTQVPPGRTVIKKLPTPEISTEPEKEAGDSLTISADGTIRCSSRGKSFDVVMDNRIIPEISLSYSANGGRVNYHLRVANGVDAAQSIALIRISIPSLPDVVVPAPWKILQAMDSSYIGIARLARDEDQTGRLSPGKGLDLSFVSEKLPGLVDVTLFPEPKPDPAYGAFFNGASPWVQQQLVKMDTPARHMVKIPALGPVTLITSDSVEQIRAEIVAAATQHPEFAGLQASLADIPVSVGRGALNKWVNQLPAGSRAGIVGAFLDALDWRLNRLP